MSDVFEVRLETHSNELYAVIRKKSSGVTIVSIKESNGAMFFRGSSITKEQIPEFLELLKEPFPNPKKLVMSFELEDPDRFSYSPELQQQIVDYYSSLTGKDITLKRIYE